MSHLRDRIWNFPATGASLRSTPSAADRWTVRRPMVRSAPCCWPSTSTSSSCPRRRCSCSSPCCSAVGRRRRRPAGPVDTLGTPLVDRRWPADEPLDPTEMLWGESGGYIKRHFPGLDVEIGKDINTPVHRGEGPGRRGRRRAGRSRPPTSTCVKSGEVEVTQELPDGTERPIRTPRRRATPSARSASCGARRAPRPSGPSPTPSCCSCPAEEFVAGVAFSAAEGNELLVPGQRVPRRRRRAGRAGRAGARRRAPVAAGRRRARRWPTPRPSSPATTPRAFTATHVVPAAGLPAWVDARPAAEPVATLGGRRRAARSSASPAPGPGSSAPTAGRAGSTAALLAARR